MNCVRLHRGAGVEDDEVLDGANITGGAGGVGSWALDLFLAQAALRRSLMPLRTAAEIGAGATGAAVDDELATANSSVAGTGSDGVCASSGAGVMCQTSGALFARLSALARSRRASMFLLISFAIGGAAAQLELEAGC